MSILVLTIWIIQGALMFVDEFIFHHRRGLGKWERLGHPVDTFFFLIPFLYTMTFTNELVFFILCAISCLVITKDEFIHSKECEAYEQWLHAVLFILHPIALFSLWFAWKNNFTLIINIQSVIIFTFMCYQIIYWNLFKRSKNEA